MFAQKKLKKIDTAIRLVDVMNRVNYKRDKYQLPEDVCGIGRKVLVWREHGSLEGCLVDDLQGLEEEQVFRLTKLN